MASGIKEEKTPLLTSGSEPDAEENAKDPTVAPGSSTEMNRPEADNRPGEDRPNAANVEDNAVAQNSCEESGNQEVYLVAMLMAMLIIATLSFTQSLSPYMIPNTDSTVALWILILYMVVGLLVILLILRFNTLVTVESTQVIHSNGSTGVQKVNKILSKYLSLVGMSFFFPFACALELCYVVAGTSCDAQWMTLWSLCNANIYTHYWVDVFYHVMRIVFMTAELLFCLQFYRTRFITHPLVRLGLMVIMVVNVALWFGSLIHETEDREKMNDGTAKMVKVCNSNTVNETHHNETHHNETHHNETLALMRCLNETTGIQKICSDMTKFLYPFTIEFSLLVGEFLAHKFFSCKKRISESQTLQLVEADEGVLRVANVVGAGPQDPLRVANAVGAGPQDQLRVANAVGAGPQDQLRVANAVGAGPQDPLRVANVPHVEHQTGSTSTYLLGSVLILAIGVGTSITFITLAFFAHNTDYKQSDEEGMPNPVIFFKVYSFFYYSLMLVFVILGFALGWKFEIRKKELRGIDYLVLMSAFGPLMYIQIYVTAISRGMPSLSGNSTYGQPKLIISDFVANIVQLSLQTVFVFFADRVKPLTDGQRSNNLLRHLHGAFKAVVFVMATYSLTNWIMDSILLDNLCFNRDFLIKIFEPDRWYLVDGILLPLLVFHRFNCFLLFTRAYLSLNDRA